MAVAPQSFARFPDLPKELRDAIWRLCLPRRVVEVDAPDPEWYFDARYQFGLDRSAEALRPDGTSAQYACRMHHTTSINSLPPIISRVCHEARSVALESANLHTFADAPQSDLFSFLPAAWVDRARDTLCLHYQPWNYSLDLSFTPILDYFLAVSKRTGVKTVSVSDDLLDCPGTSPDGVLSLLQRWPSYLVCTAVVVIHANERDAIRSGLFGALGEERVVLVDACDAHRILQYQDFVCASATKQDRVADAFFEACVNGIPKVHYAETPREFMQDLETRWLLNLDHREELNSPDTSHPRSGIWLTEPSHFEGADDDPRYQDYGELPGRPFARQMWEPNRHHPWVQEAISRMPRFHPVVMFRLCTNDCWSSPALAPL